MLRSNLCFNDTAAFLGNGSNLGHEILSITSINNSKILYSKLRQKVNVGAIRKLPQNVGFTMMCDTGGGAVEMWKTAARFPHIPTALLRCLRRFFRIERKKKVANRDGLC